MAAFNTTAFINAFKADTGPEDALVASPAYFEAYFESFPATFQNLKKGEIYDRQYKTYQNLRFRASSADLPSRQMVSVQRAFNGPHKLVPYSSIYASTIIEFIETPNYDIRTFFDTWQGLMEGNQRGFSTEYYEDLVAKSFIVQAFNREGLVVKRWRFINAFPVSVNPSQLNWSTQNGITTVSVELSYYRWENLPVTNGGKTTSGAVASSGPTSKFDKFTSKAAKFTDNANKIGKIANSFKSVFDD